MHTQTANSLIHIAQHLKVLEERFNFYFPGQRGRPKVTVTRQQLEFLVTQGYTIKRMAQLLGCSASFLYKRTKALGLPTRNSMSRSLTDEELEQHIRRLHGLYPRSGNEMMRALLRAEGLLVSRQRVRVMLTNIDPAAAARRWSAAVARRTYHVPYPNSLWHMDGNMRLISFYNEFYSFEDNGTLDPANDVHKLSLHLVYLPEIQSRLSRFREAWNHHHLRTENNRTPSQIWTDGMLTNMGVNSTSINNVFGDDPFTEQNLEGLLAQHGINNLPAEMVDQFPAVNVQPPSVDLSQEQQEEVLIAIEGIADLKLKYQRCCNEISHRLS
ncbi:unnamed protein product [Leuciscus chuanchicus]